MNWSTFGNILNTFNNGVCKINGAMIPTKTCHKHVSELNKNKAFISSIVRLRVRSSYQKKSMLCFFLLELVIISNKIFLLVLFKNITSVIS